MTEPIKTKNCPKCKRIKPLSEFHKSRATKDGLQNYCRQCKWQYSKQYRQTHKEERKQYYKTLQGHLNSVWHNILRKCNNPTHPHWKYYGGRGIKVKFACFEDFYNYVIKELKADPRGLTIDRIDNDGHYEPSNIRFVSQSENLRNRRSWAKKHTFAAKAIITP